MKGDYMDVFIANDNLVMVPINDGVTAIIMCRTGKIVVANKATTNLISFCAVPQTLETLYRDLKSFGYAELKEEEIEQCVKSLIAEGTMHLDSVEPFNSCRYQTCILPFPEAAPKTMYLHPTHNCNLLCSYCYNKVVRKSDPCIEHELSFDEWNSIVEQIIDIGVESIIITGGEPLIRSELLYTWKKAKLAGLSVTLGTNGVLIVDKFMAAKVSDSVSLIN
jgi:sulfatase maturation enzyme AslB (radical SAM superfamily)